jgi:hypothetical protein
MSLPAGYTTSTSHSGSLYTTNLYYEGALIAAVTADSSTWETTIHDYVSGQQWTTGSPAGLQPGGTWTLDSDASVTANSSGSELSGLLNGANGYALYGVDTSGYYYSSHYHPALYSSPYEYTTNIKPGTGGGCGGQHCKYGPGSTFSCVVAIIVAIMGALAFGLLVVGSGPLTAGAVAGLIIAHTSMLWGFVSVFMACM